MMGPRVTLARVICKIFIPWVILDSEKQYPKDVFFTENLWETPHTCQGEFLSKEYSTDVFVSETFSRKIFCQQLRKVSVMELLPNYHKSPQESKGHTCMVLLENTVLFVQTVRPNFKLIIPIPQHQYLVNIITST